MYIDGDMIMKSVCGAFEFAVEELSLDIDGNISDYVNVEKVKEELADIFNYAILIADKYDLDIKQIVIDKLRQNAEKYPVDKAYGSAKKYDEL